MTPIKAIRLFCLSCVGYSKQEVRLCPSTGCPLYCYRMGHRPKGQKTSESSSFGNENDVVKVGTNDCPSVKASETRKENARYEDI